MNKLSIFTTVGHENCQKITDPYIEAIKCYSELADEVIIMNGSGIKKFPYKSLFMANINMDKIRIIDYEWPEEFDWKFIGEQFNRGYMACSGDWVIHADLDFFFHEKNFDEIRRSLDFYSDEPALGFLKNQFLLVDRFRIKSRLILAVNKKKFGDRIQFNSGGDLCQPSLDGKEIKVDDIRVLRIPFYNYDFCFKDKETIAYEFNRMAKARHKDFPDDNWGYESEEKALEYFKNMMVGRFNNNDGWQKIRLQDHPKYIQEKIKNITPEQFGYNAFGWFGTKIEYK